MLQQRVRPSLPQNRLKPAPILTEKKSWLDLSVSQKQQIHDGFLSHYPNGWGISRMIIAEWGDAKTNVEIPFMPWNPIREQTFIRLAYKNQELIGWCMAIYDAKTSRFLVSTFVYPQHRNNGVGYRLFKEVEKELNQKQANRYHTWPMSE